MFAPIGNWKRFMNDAGLTYSGALVRQHDHDRFLASLFVAADRRPALWALYAFNYEIARTREVVSDTTMGLIRLQWWHDAFAGIYAGREAAPHEILRDLAAAIGRHSLPQQAFENLLYAREFDLEDTPPENLQGLEHYADFTATPLLTLAAAIAGDKAQDVAPVAKAYALAGILRAVPFHASQRRCYLPMDPEALYAGDTAQLKETVKAVAERAAILLAQARPQGRMARVVAAQARMRLKQLERLDFNILDTQIGGLPPFYALRLWWTSLKKS